jgi:signal transduction histidine kinase
LPAEVEITFYRVVQEALNNVIKHAHATRADVVLEWHADIVVLLVEDDGVGFDGAAADRNATGIGLIGMRERAALIGGSLEIESAPGRVRPSICATRCRRKRAGIMKIKSFSPRITRRSVTDSSCSSTASPTWR